MTMPLTSANLIAQRSGVSADAFAARTTMLQRNGHDWMPADMQASLASSEHSDSDVLAIADGIKQSLAQKWNGFTEAFDDNVLHKQPSHALTLARYLHASLGPLPVREDDLSVIQRNLQKAGFGAGLSVNGVWGADWNSAYNDWADYQRTEQLAGDKPGSVKTSDAGHGIFDALLPSHAINAVIGYVKSIPGDVRTLAADLTAGAEFIARGPFQGDDAEQHIIHREAAVEHALGNEDLTEDEIRRQGLSRQLSDLAMVLSIVPVAGQASRAAIAARGAWEAGVTMEAAQRTTGTIAKSFLGGRTRQMIEEGAARRGVLNSRVFSNVPLLRQVGPAIGKVYDADGLYYRTRTMLAAPYALPAVRIAGDIGQRTMLTGGAIGLGAKGIDQFGGQTSLTGSIENERTFDEVGANIDRLIGAGDSHAFTHAVDTLGLVLHGPLGSTVASTAVGGTVENLTNRMGDVLGHYNAEGVWERAATKATGSRTRIEHLRDAFGSEEMFDRFMANKTADLAAAHYAQNTAQKEGLVFGSQEYRTRVGELADDVWNNSDLHHDAVRELMANPIEFENRVAADMLHNRLHPSSYHEDLLDDLGDGDVSNYAANGIAWMDAGSHLQNVLKTGLARYLYGGDGRTLIRQAQDNFDFGADMDNPVRTSTMVRRTYVQDVSDTLTRVRRQVDEARAHLAGDVEAGRRFEAAIDKGNLHDFAAFMKQFAGPKRSRAKWDRLVKDISRVRRLVDQGTPEPLTLRHLLDEAGDPERFADELYSNINGEPRSVPSEIGSGDWLREHLQHKSGALGLGRLDTKSTQQATADIGRLRARLNATSDPDKIMEVVEDAKNYAFREFGMTERTLGVFDRDPNKLLNLLDERAHQLASEVFLTPDAPQELTEALEEIRKLGYRPMLGSHIGHLWDTTLPPMPDLKGAVSRRRRIASTLGLAPEQISNRDAGRDASIRVLREVNRALEDDRVRLPARTTAETVMQVLRDKNLVHPELRGPEQLAYTVGKVLRTHKRGIEQLAEEMNMDSHAPEVEAAYKATMAQALQLRDIPRAKFIEALTTPGEFSNGAHWAGVDKTTANLIRRAVLRGYADRPGYIQGLSTIEDWARGGFSIGGKVSPAVRFAGDNPLAEIVQKAAELPNSLVNLRNRLRFTLSPYFDFRRVAKQNVKMSIDGVTPVLNPLAHMVDNGTFTKAHKYLRELLGDPATMGFDDADRYLHQQSVWGLYNSRHFEAYYAWEKKREGWTDDQIRQGIRRVFEYGSTRHEGRSALERTVNTVFFPFSFEKTLLRNVGAYMIDHPQQALLMTAAISAYDDANQNARVHEWVDAHLPILRDIEKLNAFAHGISPGEMGGINAPLLNLFLPQKWDGGFTKDNLKRFLPVWNDFGKLIADTREQAVIGKNATLNLIDYAVTWGKPRGELDPYRPMVTRRAQQEAAYRKRNHFILALTPILDRNASTTDPNAKVKWPDVPGLPDNIVGKPIDRTTISKLMKVWYPAYDPNAARIYAVQAEEQLGDEIDRITAKNPTRGREYEAFRKLAESVAGHLQRNDYDTDQARSLMNAMRRIAGDLSETDPDFYRIYREHFDRILGPLEEVPA